MPLVYLYGDETVFQVLQESPGILCLRSYNTTPDDIMFLGQALKNPSMTPKTLPVWDGKPLDIRFRKTYSGQNKIGQRIARILKGEPAACPQVVHLENIDTHVDAFFWFTQVHEDTVLHRGHGSLRDDDLPHELTIGNNRITPAYVDDPRIQQALIENRLHVPDHRVLVHRGRQRFIHAILTLAQSVPVVMTGFDTPIIAADGTRIRFQPAAHLPRLLYQRIQVLARVERGQTVQHNQHTTTHSILDHDTLHDILGLPYIH